MTGRGHRGTLIVAAGSLALLALSSTAASAQRLFGPPTIADSSISTAASRVYELERSVKRSPNDAVKWHELGVLAWALEPAVLAGSLPLEKPMRLAVVADTALQTAAMIDARNVKYQMYAANRLLASNVGLSRVGSRKYFKRAVEAARLAKDNRLLAAAALEYGRTVWWRFESTEHRHQFIGGAAPRSLNDAMQPLARGAASLEHLARELMAGEMLGLRDPRALTPAMIDGALQNVSTVDMQFRTLPRTTFAAVFEMLTSGSQSLPKDLTGWMEYEEASKLFHEAYRADPAYPGAFRAVAMTYAARNLWSNLERAATQHINTHPGDSLAWLSLGLARHRSGNLSGARLAFDSALVLLGPSERRRLDNWRRVVPTGRDAYTLLSSASADQDLYWKVAAPLWSNPAIDTRLEFLARVTYSELRWTVEEFGVSGADSDRGAVYVRHGPPDKIYGFGTSITDDAADMVQFWVYNNGLIFAFSGMPTFGTMRIPVGDAGMVDELNRLFPVRWDNVAAPMLDSLDTQVARFRAGVDSLDVAVAVEYQDPDSIARTQSIAAPVQRHLWIARPGGESDQHLAGTLTAAGVHLWQVRVTPGTMLYRAEAFAESATRGQRATGIIDATTPAFPLSGTGLSDLLLARGLRDSTARRWSAMGALPVIRGIQRGDALTVLWEHYEFGEREGRAEYDVTLTLKAERGRGARIRAEIIGALASLVRTDIAPDQVTMTFSRTVPHAAAFVDWVSLKVPEAPEGRYAVTISVTDRISGKTLTRSSSALISK